MKSFLVVVLLSLGLCCGVMAQESAPAAAEVGTVYGKAVKKSGTKTVDAVTKALEKADKFTGKLSGKVTRVCSTKGCWLALQSDDSDQAVVVRFKDYGFFVPQDIVGRTVVVEGYAKAKDKEDEDGNMVRNISFTADGVLVVK